MKIGLDLDGTVYAHPGFFAEMIHAFTAAGHTFFCISSHARAEWPEDCERLAKRGVPHELIDPSLMNPTRHGELSIKGRACDACDFVFDDDTRLQGYTRTPVFAPLRGA
jgi:hypothetical protein